MAEHMSSGEEDYNDGDNGGSQNSKKRRIQRACDICRRKKIRCDGSQMPGNRCSNCIAYNFECTYIEAAKKRGPPKGYVESLETRLEKMERLFQRLCPDADFRQELGGQFDRDSWSYDKNTSVMSSSSTTSPTQLSNLSAIGRLPTGPEGETVDDLAASDEEFAQNKLADEPLTTHPLTYHRFFGKSSGIVLVKKAMTLKNEYTGLPPKSFNTTDEKWRLIPAKRREFWEVKPWELPRSDDEVADYTYPDDDLLSSLVDFYFTQVNIFLPLLHRPTFEKSLADGLHLQDEGFGAVVLLVCAVGSRYSHDPRIFLPEVNSTHSCGWKWFEQVRMVRRSLLSPPRLYDLQMHCLAVLFLQGSSAPQSCWTMVGIGVRFAQDVGAHRRKVYNTHPTVEDEMWKRAFWALVCLDRTVSSTLGRPCAIQDEDFDLDLPVECDDEYWVNPDPEKAFKQPPGKPSRIAFFISYLKLMQILAFALRTIYSINKSKILLGFVGQQWEQHIVAELDSALNKWVDSVPDHLRWDPTREDLTFFHQSASLYASYYHLQILVHRPFIPSPRKPSPLSFPSLAICTNAARSCSHVVDIARRRTQVSLPFIQMAVFTAGIVLLLNIWGGKRSGLSADPAKEMADVHKCMQILRANEERWHSAGRLWDILHELASVGDLPLPKPSPVTNMKRERDSDSPISTTSIPSPVVNNSSSSASSPSYGPTDGPRNIAGARRVSRDLGGSVPQQQQPPAPQQSNPPPMQPPSQPSTFALPMYSNELGSLPVHGQVNFDPRASALDHMNNIWYSLNMSDTPAGVGDMSNAFPMDQIFFDTMASNFAAASMTPSAPGQLHPNSGENRYAAPMADVNPILDNDTMAMWSNAPTGFELDDWGTYITSVSGMMQNQHPPDQSNS